MSKILDFLKKIPNAYYNWKRRNEDLATFLREAKSHRDKIDHIDIAVTGLSSEVQHIKDKVQNLETQIDQVNGRLEVIGRGTKMELFDTLHNWRVALVVHRKWASPAEKREIEEIYRIYHDDLKGNGQGERYYNEIMALPESEEELHKLHEE